MAPKLRRLERGEEAAFIKSVRVPFLDPATGSPDDDAANQRRAARLEVERMWVVEDHGHFVGNGGVRSMDLTVPASPGRACPIIGMGGVTAVGIHPTHRRRGLLTRMMTAMLDDSRRRGEPVAGLIASESVIYGRFGFGLASDSVDYRLDSARSAFGAPAPERDIRLLDHAGASKVLPGLFDAARAARNGRAGEPSRTPAYWQEVFADKPSERIGATGLMFAVCGEGYAAYRARRGADVLRGERVEIVVEEITGTDPETEAALWRFVLDLDLIGSVTFRRRPLDEPVRWRLSDPRQMQTAAVEDRLYLRVLDVPAALTARSYRSEGRLVLDVQPAANRAGGTDTALGVWVLDAGPEGSQCARAQSGQDPDLRLSVTSLGSLYLGGVKASTLAAAGLIEELTAGALEAADRLLAATPSPLTVTGF